MTSNRIRRHPAYDIGRMWAEGISPNGVQWTSSIEGREAFKAGYAERKAELEEMARNDHLATADISMLLLEARAERDFDKLCAVVERLIER